MLQRREFLKLGAFLIDPLQAWPANAARTGKRVIIAGAGLAGLSCAWELLKRGHDVVVLEASNRAGGHVRTIREGFPDGLYADCGAEHFTKPGYDLCYRYAEEFGLTLLPYPHRDNQLVVADARMMPEREARQWGISHAGYTQKEREFLKRHERESLAALYLNRYAERINNEYEPFAQGLDWLDGISLTEMLKREGASHAAIEDIGSDSSALHVIWKWRIIQLRGIPEEPRTFFRVKGGNEMLPMAIAHRLGDRLWTNSPVVEIRRGDRGVAVTVRKTEGEQKVEGDYLVCCMNAVVLRQLRVTPPWPETKRFAIENVPYTVETRPIFQSRSKFWRRDGFSGNMEFNSPLLGPLWPTADEVSTSRGIMIGTAQAGVSAAAAMSVFQRYYPGHSADFEKTMAFDWSRDRWAMACEARGYKPGQLHQLWPAVIEPVGRVYFAGAYCDNQSWGMEAATRSAFRVARHIHEQASRH